jgi:hypothetical protein
VLQDHTPTFGAKTRERSRTKVRLYGENNAANRCFLTGFSSLPRLPSFMVDVVCNRNKPNGEGRHWCPGRKSVADLVRISTMSESTFENSTLSIGHLPPESADVHRFPPRVAVFLCCTGAVPSRKVLALVDRRQEAPAVPGGGVPALVGVWGARRRSCQAAEEGFRMGMADEVSVHRRCRPSLMQCRAGRVLGTFSNHKGGRFTWKAMSRTGSATR